MSLDARVPSSVAWRIALLGAIGLAGCPRTEAPEAPGTEPTPPSVDRRPGTSSGGTSTMLGELCVGGAGGRPGIAPIVARQVSWTASPEELTAPLDRGQTGAFAVLGADGRRVGVFSAIGTSDGVAMGSYAGGSPCAVAGAAGAAPVDDPACVAATGGCGLAVAPISSGGAFAAGALEPPEVATGGACVSEGQVVLDVDGDGTNEVFPLTAFLDGSRAPADEIPAATAVAPACKPSFARYGIAIAVDAAIADPRHKVTLDILGVLDIDGDGRREVVVGLRYAERRTIAVYSAVDSAARLALIGEAEPWPKP